MFELKRSSLLGMVCAVAALAAACQAEEADKNVAFVMSVDGDDRIARFQTFPLHERLRIFDEVYENSGHPRDVSLARGFADKPSESLTSVVDRLRKSTVADFSRYIAIVFWIANDSDFDICSDPSFQELRRVFASYNLDLDRKNIFAQYDFGGCHVVEVSSP